MKKIFSKLGFDERMSKNFCAILIVAVGGAIIYGLPYFRYDYYNAYLVAYNVNDMQMGVFGSILGIFGMVSYLFGGVVADKISTRIILTASLVGTGLGGFLHLLPLTFIQLCLLYAFWGVTSLFAFWPACIKAVRLLSGSEDQGKAFGFFEGGRGIAAALMSMGAVIVFRIFAGSNENSIEGMRTVILFYSILTILMGILAFLIIKKDEKIEKNESFSLKGIKEALKIPAVWIIGIVTFSNYVFTLSLYYFTPYATNILGATITFAALLASLKRWFSLFGNVGGGYATDKVGTGNVLLVSFIIMILGTIGILILPTKSSSIILFTVLFIIIYIFYNVNYAMTWAMMEEGAIPKEYTGTATGIIATIGYLPEIFISLIAGSILQKYPGVKGFRYFFGFVIIMLLIGSIFVLVWKKYLKKNKEKKSGYV